MRVEIPSCTRCCFCIPLRYGIIICGYLNLISSLMILALEAAISIKFYPSWHTVTIYKGVTFYCHVWVIIILYITEIIFSTILLIGAHTKKMYLLRVFYYYNIATLLASLVTFLVARHDDNNYYTQYVAEFCLAFSIFVFQINLLLMIRTELNKIRYKTQTTFVNHVTEAVVAEPLPEGRNPL